MRFDRAPEEARGSHTDGASQWGRLLTPTRSSSTSCWTARALAEARLGGMRASSPACSRPTLATPRGKSNDCAIPAREEVSLSRRICRHPDVERRRPSVRAGGCDKSRRAQAVWSHLTSAGHAEIRRQNSRYRVGNDGGRSGYA